ncbi:MAG: hypothetical protein ACE5E8_11230, partial [Acidimicrobiia bacterium]
MTMLERQVRATQHRLWINRGFSILSTMLCGGAGVFAALVLVVRLFDLTWPLAWIGLALAAVAASAALVRLMVTREGPSIAAARLDEAAGLRERLSSAHYCTTTDDPFARAVVSDAELVSGSLSARQHIRLVMPRSAGWTTAVLLLAALMFLVPP